MRLFVGNIPFSTTDGELKEHFESRGFPVSRVEIPLEKETRRVRGFAFVDLARDVDHLDAISEVDGTEMGKRVLQVNEARPKERREQAGRY